MRLGGTGGSAAAVSSGPSAQKYDDIARVGSLANHVLSRSRAHDSANLHTFCHIARMIDLIYQSGGQTDLVAVGAVTLRRTHSELSLRELAL